MSTESKTLTFQVKDLGVRTDDSGQEFGQIEAYGAIFNNVDEGRDRILPGAFTRTIQHSKARAQAREKKYLAPMLWQHNTSEVIGGWYEMSEDATGLRAKGDISLATQRGSEYYALAKAGMSDEFSIIYDVPAGGAKFDKSGVRDLSELRLFSIDPVTFAMNDATFTVAVKAASDDDKAAQEARSKKYGIGIKDGGNVTKPSKWSSVPDEQWGDPVNYRYPMPDKSHADNAASRFGASSARSGYSSAEQGIIDKRIAKRQASFGESDDDSKKASRKRMQRKTFAEHYQEEQCSDLLEDWYDVLLCSFTKAVYDAFQEGDTVESDVNDAVDGLKAALDEWVANAVKYDLVGYIDECSDTYDGGLYRMQRGSSPYGYMSREQAAMQRKAELKAMLASDATTGGFGEKEGSLVGPHIGDKEGALIGPHIDKLRSVATKAMKAVDGHTSMLYDAATQVKSLLGPDVVTNTPAKAGRAFSAANAQALSDHADALEGAADKLAKKMTRHMKMVNNVADDLATVIQGSEAAYGTDPGTPDDGNQEGKQYNSRNSGRASQTSLLARASRLSSAASSHSADTLPAEEDIADALKKLRKLRTA